jgi:hypothetical protein
MQAVNSQKRTKAFRKTQGSTNEKRGKEKANRCHFQNEKQQDNEVKIKDSSLQDFQVGT